MLSLTEIFDKYPDTDKGGTGPHALHSYDQFYEQLFEPIRGKVESILEVGVRGGGSLKAWKEYFYNIKVVAGIDNGSEAGIWTPDVDGIEIFKADTLKPETVVETFSAMGIGTRAFDIIIDDGCHKSWSQACTYGVLKPYLKGGGIYVIEDIESIEEARKLHELLGGAIEDRKRIKGRHDDILLYFN